MVNGELEGFFASHRGIRQCCSLSPYIFVMAQNVLSCLLNKAARDGRIGKHPRCDHVSVTHLSFADDILVFSDGSPQSPGKHSKSLKSSHESLVCTSMLQNQLYSLEVGTNKLS